MQLIIKLLKYSDEFLKLQWVKIISRIHSIPNSPEVYSDNIIFHGQCYFLSRHVRSKISTVTNFLIRIKTIFENILSIEFAWKQNQFFNNNII